MTDPKNPSQPQPRTREQYEALVDFTLAGSNRQVKAGDAFDASTEELASVTEGTHYRKVR